MNGHRASAISQMQKSFFLYDIDALEAQAKAITSTLAPGIKIFYATKANPLKEIVSTLYQNGFGVDVASMGELQQAQNAGVTPDKLIATGPAKSKEYLSKLMDAKVSTIVLESINQLKWLNELCLERNTKQQALLRVQLNHNSDSKSVLGGSSITPFGLGVEDWVHVELSYYPLVDIRGLHCFQWGNILSLTQLEGIWHYTMKECLALAKTLNLKCEVIDLGGGLGIPYQKNQNELSFESVHSLLNELKTEFNIPEVWLELGRFSVGSIGQYFTKIIDMKSVRGRNMIVTEGGINHIARSALTGEAFPCEAVSTSSASKKTFHIHGPLCTALDFLGEHELPSDLKMDDWLVFAQSGAYGFTESMPYFLCHDLAGEAFIKGNKLSVARNPIASTGWMA